MTWLGSFCRRWVWTFVVFLAVCSEVDDVHSKDFGTYGALFPIHEQDVLELIVSGFVEMEKSGRLDEIRQDSERHVRARVERPLGRSFPRAEVNRSFTIDLSITVDRDLADHQGRVFAPAGTRVNPLEYSRFSKRIVMIDGDDPDQVAFALSEGNELDTLIVLTNGPSLELMRKHGRRFWFDADGQMATKFGVQALPSVVTRADPLMRVEEIDLEGDG